MIGSFNADVTLVSESERGNLKKKKQQESTGQVSNLNETRDCKGNSEGVMGFSTHTPKASYIQPAPSPIASKLQLYSQVYSRKRWSKRKSISGRAPGIPLPLELDSISNTPNVVQVPSDNIIKCGTIHHTKIANTEDSSIQSECAVAEPHLLNQEAADIWEMVKSLGVTTGSSQTEPINKIVEMENRDRKEAQSLGSRGIVQ